MNVSQFLSELTIYFSYIIEITPPPLLSEGMKVWFQKYWKYTFRYIIIKIQFIIICYSQYVDRYATYDFFVTYFNDMVFFWHL